MKLFHNAPAQHSRRATYHRGFLDKPLNVVESDVAARARHDIPKLGIRLVSFKAQQRNSR